MWLQVPIYVLPLLADNPHYSSIIRQYWHTDANIMLHRFLFRLPPDGWMDQVTSHRSLTRSVANVTHLRPCTDSLIVLLNHVARIK